MDKEGGGHAKMRGDGVDLAKGLGGTTAFTQVARAEIETQLSEGLALYADPRTRSAGQVRIDQLSQYRNVMNRISRSSLSAEQRAALGPAFAFAQTHPEAAAKVLDVVDEYAAACAEYDALPKRGNPVANLRKATEEAARLVEGARQGFIASTRDLGSGGLAVTPEGLAEQEAELHSLIDLYTALDGMQKTLETLNGYKPRPFGGIEARVQKAALAAPAAFKSYARTDAMRALLEIAELAKLSAALGDRSLAAVAP